MLDPLISPAHYNEKEESTPNANFSLQIFSKIIVYLQIIRGLQTF